MRSIAMVIHIGIAIVAYVAMSPASAQQKPLQYKFDLKSLFSSDQQQDKKLPETQPAVEHPYQPPLNEKTIPVSETAQSQNNMQDTQGSADTSGATSEWLGRFETCLKAYESIVPGQSIDKADECVNKAQNDAYEAGVTKSVSRCLLPPGRPSALSVRSVWNYWMNNEATHHNILRYTTRPVQRKGDEVLRKMYEQKKPEYEAKAACLNSWPYFPILAKLNQIDKMRLKRGIAETQADATKNRESDIDARIRKLLQTP